MIRNTLCFIAILLAGWMLAQAQGSGGQWTNRSEVLRMFDSETERAVTALEDALDEGLASTPAKLTQAYALIEIKMWPNKTSSIDVEAANLLDKGRARLSNIYADDAGILLKFDTFVNGLVAADLTKPTE